MITKTQVHNIRTKMISNPRFLVAAMMVIYSYQTADEKLEEETIWMNRVGFNINDAPYLTEFAKIQRETGKLNDGQLKDARRMMPKYARQVTELLYRAK